MDKDLAKRLVKETLQNPFTKSNFSQLVKEICKKIDTGKAFPPIQGAYLPEIFRPYIKNYERIGTYTDPKDKKIDILIVNLQKNSSLENARTAQRNFVARYLKDRNAKDAAIVAFVSPDDSNWRFSFVKMEYKLEQSVKGKLNAKEEFTPARRYSFLVGAEENSHTAQSRLLSLLLDDVHCPLLDELEESFGIEKVTKEFFEKYRGLFLEVRDALAQIIADDCKIKTEFESKGVDASDFSKKLLGQIVFLYFLQKKGWFGVDRDATWGTGPKNFLRRLFTKEVASYTNFFNNILEPLFYEALARERDSNFYNQFNCKIPFLNGGLFDPISNYDWVHTDILLPNELFSNDYKTTEGDVGTGILDVFDRYNFTVKEDEPLEKEVAIDPEMLGQVFENLLEVKDRKSKGTYYTPRAIVHYMCQQSLIYYLITELNEKVSQTDIETFIKYGESALENDARVEAKGKETDAYSYKLPISVRENAELIDSRLASIKVCDPAVGSGAFLVGMMSEIVRARKTLTAYLGSNTKRTPYEFKHHAIHSNLYGVDIDPSAVEIAKLRLWLSLVVDEDDIKQVKPLPNLDYKIMQGNSLLEEYEGVKLFDEKLLSDINPVAQQYAELEKRKQQLNRKNRDLLFEKHDPVKVAMLREESKKIAKLERELQDSKTYQETENLFAEVSPAEKASQLKALHERFFDETRRDEKRRIKAEIDKVELELIEATLKENGKINALERLSHYTQGNRKPFFLWKLHFSEVFRDKNGFDVVVANPPYVSAWSMEKENADIRGIIKRSLKDYSILAGHWDLYIAFVAKGHQLLCEHGSLSYIVPNPILREKYATETRLFLLESMRLRNLLEFSDINVFENVARRTTVLVAQKSVEPDDYQIQIFGNINECIAVSNCVQKTSWLKQPKHSFLIKGNISEDELVLKIESQSNRIGNFFYVNYGAQVSSKVKGGFGKGDVIGKKPKGNAKEFYEGKDVKRWCLNYRGLYLDYRARELYGPRAPELFEQSKITVRKVSDKNHKISAALDNTRRYTDDGNILIVPYESVIKSDLRKDFEGYQQINISLSLKYVLAIILSNLESFYFKNRFATESLQGAASHTYRPCQLSGCKLGSMGVV